jgi:hypothetical protein
VPQEYFNLLNCELNNLFFVTHEKMIEKLFNRMNIAIGEPLETTPERVRKSVCLNNRIKVRDRRNA